MSGIVIGALIILALVLGGAVIGLWFRLRAVTRREALQALAARRGWALNVAQAKLGGPASVRLQPRGGAGWHVTARRARPAQGKDAGRPATTDYDAEEPVWTSGWLALVPGEPGEDAIALVQDAAREQAGSDPGLSIYPGPAGLHVIASADPALRADLPEIAKLYAGWRDAGYLERPILTLGPGGIRLRLQKDIQRADEMEVFIDLAQDLARVLSTH
jgi:hypothetical protein